MKNKIKKTTTKSLNLQYNTKISTLEKEYGIKFKMPSDTKLGDFIRHQGYPSLADMLLS